METMTSVSYDDQLQGPGIESGLFLCAKRRVAEEAGAGRPRTVAYTPLSRSAWLHQPGHAPCTGPSMPDPLDRIRDADTEAEAPRLALAQVPRALMAVRERANTSG